MLLQDFYSPEEIQRATRLQAEEASEIIGTNAIIDSPISPQQSEGMKRPDTISSYLHTFDLASENPLKASLKLSEVTLTIGADLWRYNMVPRFQRRTDKITFWSLLLGISICTV